jgi:hypothetical protein
MGEESVGYQWTKLENTKEGEGVRGENVVTRWVGEWSG